MSFRALFDYMQSNSELFSTSIRYHPYRKKSPGIHRRVVSRRTSFRWTIIIPLFLMIGTELSMKIRKKKSPKTYQKPKNRSRIFTKECAFESKAAGATAKKQQTRSRLASPRCNNRKAHLSAQARHVQLRTSGALLFRDDRRGATLHTYAGCGRAPPPRPRGTTRVYKTGRPRPREAHHLPSSSGGTSFEVIERITMNDVPLMISTRGPATDQEGFLSFTLMGCFRG